MALSGYYHKALLSSGVHFHDNSLKSSGEHTIVMGFPSQCSSKEWAHPYKKACYVKYHLGPSPGLFRWTMLGDFANNSERHGVPSWKQQLDFIFIHNSQELEMQIEEGMQEMQRAGLELCVDLRPTPVHLLTWQIFILSPLFDFRQTAQPFCASVSLSVN